MVIQYPLQLLRSEVSYCRSDRFKGVVGWSEHGDVRRGVNGIHKLGLCQGASNGRQARKGCRGRDGAWELQDRIDDVYYTAGKVNIGSRHGRVLKQSGIDDNVLFYRNRLDHLASSHIGEASRVIGQGVRERWSVRDGRCGEGTLQNVILE